MAQEQRLSEAYCSTLEGHFGGGGADIDNGTRGRDGAEGGIADTGDSPPLTLNPNELQEATNEELMSMLRHQSARLQKLEEEYSRLKSKATPRDGGQVAQRDLERSQKECQLAKDNARELAERYTALQEKFRTMEGSTGGGHRGADYNKLVERMKGLIGKYKEAQGTIRSLQSQVEELRAHRVATSPKREGGGGEGDSGPGRDEGAGNPDFGTTIAALQDQLREVTRAKDDAEKRAEMAAAASTVPGERVEEGREYETVAELKTQLEKKQTENESIASRLNELAQRYRALQQEDEARKAEYNSAAAERVADMERQLAASDEKAVDLVRRCEVAEAGHERIEGSLKIALSRVVDLDSSATSATASVAAVEKELRAARGELREAKDENEETSTKLEAKTAEFQNILGKAKELADRYRKLQALSEGSASELADAHQREEQHLAEASAMREELARAAEQCTAATAAVAAVREKSEARIDELAEQLAAATRGASEKVGALEEKLRRATKEEADERADAERRLREELEQVAEQLLEDQLREHEADARRRASELESENETLKKELIDLRDSRDGLDARAAELDSAVKVAAARMGELVDRLKAAELQARDADAAAEEALATGEATKTEFQKFQQRQEDALTEAALAAEDTHTRLQSELDHARKEVVMARERANVAEEEAQELRSELERARATEEEARAAERRLSERLEAASHGVSEQISTLEAQCSQAQQDRLSAEEECRSLAQQLAGLTEEHGALEGKLAEAKAEAENIRTHGEEKTRGMLEEQARVAEHAMTVAIREALDKARVDEAARFLVEVKKLSSGHTEVLARASATAEREVSRVRLEAEEDRAALASELVSAEEQLAAATARAEEFAEDLRVARARELYVTRRVEELEAAEEDQRVAVEAEMESVRRELDRACGAEQDAAGEIERLAAQLESAQDGASSEAATLREQMAAAEGARQAAVLRATSLEEEVSRLRASAAEAAVAAKTVEVEAREEAARLSQELDAATEAAAAEEQRAKILAAELANVKAAAVTAEESTKAAVAEAVERAEAEREKAIGNMKTIRILEEQTMMARRTAEEAQSRLEAMGTEAEALREKAQTSEGRVAKLQARVTELETKLVELEASEQSARERYDVVSSKLKELISRYKELRDSALASESNAESAEAGAIEAERQASAFREERDAAREEVGAMRGVVQAADSQVLSLSEELEQVRQARNRLDGRRAELQMALGAEKLRRAFGVAGGSGATGAAAADVFEGVLKRWRLACLEGRQGRLERESEENRGKAESFQGLVQRLSEELERQGQAVNHHAKVICQRESELEAALDRANRAHDELIAMEPPSLSQAIGGVEILLRVSTQPAPSMAVAAGTEEKSGPVEEDAGASDRGGQSENEQEDVWCLVRYEKVPSFSKKRGGISKETDVWTLSVEKGKAESGLEAGEHTLDGHGDEEGDGGAGQAPARAAVEAKVEAAKMTEEWEKHEGKGEAEQAPLTVSPSACGGDDGNAGGDAAAAAPRTAEGEDSEGQPSPPSSLPSSASVAGQDTVVVIEWRIQGEVDDWFATRLETAVEEEDYQQERSRLERAEGDAGEETAAATAEASMVAPRLLPVLETPLTIQESFAAEMARVEAELNSKLEMTRAELSRNTEAYKQYRARAHTAIKNSGASQREAEARITQAHRELATERELVRETLEDRAAAEARWAEESATLKQHIDEMEARVESAAVRTSELEAGMARSVEEGVNAARDETAEVRRRFKEQEAATAEAREALATANAELEKVRREVKQRGQLARNLLAEKDAEITRLRSGGRGVGAGVNVGGLEGEISPDVNGDALGFQQGKVSPSAVDGVSSSSPDPASDSVVGAPPSLGAAAMGTATDGTSPASLPAGREGRKRLQEGGGEKGPADQQQKKPADSHHAEQQILQMARVQSQRDDEMGRLRVKLQRQSEEIRAREERLAARDEEKERLRKHIEELEAEATRSKDLLDQEHGREKMTYLKNVVKKFVVSEGNERHRLVPVLATILSFSPAELSEVDRAVASAGRSGGSSWTSMFGSA